MLGKSRFNRRSHRVAGLFLTLFNILGETCKELNANLICNSSGNELRFLENLKLNFKREHSET